MNFGYFERFLFIFINLFSCFFSTHSSNAISTEHGLKKRPSKIQYNLSFSHSHSIRMLFLLRKLISSSTLCAQIYFPCSLFFSRRFSTVLRNEIKVDCKSSLFSYDFNCHELSSLQLMCVTHTLNVHRSGRALHTT